MPTSKGRYRGRAPLFEKGAIAPNLPIMNAQGERAQLWDLRNKSHVAIVVGPNWEAPAAAHQKTWDWLGVKIYGAADGANALDPGVYAVDRFGAFITYLPMSADVWEKLEKEYIYHEAKHC